MEGPSGGAGPEPTGKTPFDILVERLTLPAWSGRLAHVLVLVVASLGASLLLSSGLSAQQIPALTREDIGRPFRASSPSGFKAGRDYAIPNRDITEQRRAEARAAVRPVFDLNPYVLGDSRRALREAFAAMREAVEEERKALAPKEPSAAPAPPADTAKTAPSDNKENGKAKPKTDEGAEEAAITQRLIAERKGFEQRLFPLEDEDFQVLVNARFSEAIEQATVFLVEQGYPGPVVGSREELQHLNAQGISVRSLDGGAETVSGVMPPALWDVREAKAELDRFASVPGNVLPEANPVVRRAVLRVAKRQLRPNLTVNIAETEARRAQAANAIKEAVIEVKKGQRVIGDGELITEQHLVILSGMRSQTDPQDLVQLQLGVAGLVALLICCAYVFHRAAFRRFRPTRKDAVLLAALLLAMLGLLNLWITVGDAVHEKYGRVPVEALYYCAPVAAGAMIIRFILTEELALFFALVVSCLAGVMLGNSLPFAIYALVASVTASHWVGRAKDRVGILRAGAITGAVSFAMVLCLSMAEGKGLTSDALVSGLFALVGTAVAVPTLVVGLTPLLEISLGYASDIKLLELANLNHPALKELIVQAPGTYHHSIIVGSLVEAAAEEIGANPLLARSCAYYHDIGKGRNPLYFGENQKGENRHDTLAPAMSAVIIKRHVTEGMEMARQYKLPKLVADAIPQHHGTRFVGYFFHKAQKEQEGKENAAPIDESIYRYAGPKPQFREAALVMIADAVESSCRSLAEPTSAKLQAQVQKIINIIFSEGQLDECDLTLRDLNLIAQSFLHTLEGIYHARPVYPPGAVGGSKPGPDGGKGPTLTVAGRPAAELRLDVKRSATGQG
jgi:putative nucleotidyltransferase with HDIG domain